MFIPMAHVCITVLCIETYTLLGSTGATAHSKAYFGEGNGPVHLNSVECSGMEYNLTDCKTMNSGIETSHSLDVGVKCQPGIYIYIYMYVCIIYTKIVMTVNFQT